MNITLLAHLLSKNHLTEADAADFFGFEGPLRTRFIDETADALIDFTMDKTIAPLEKTLKTFGAIALGFAQKNVNDLATIESTYRKVGYVLMGAATIIEKGITKLTQDSATAAAMSDAVHATTTAAMESTIVGGVLGVASIILTHFQYNTKDKLLGAVLSQSVDHAERSYEALQEGTHIKISAHYASILKKMREENPIDQKLYKETMEGWLEMERGIAKEVIRQQEIIAAASADVQEAQSKRTKDQIMNALSVALVFTSLAAPPIAIAASIVKSVAFLGVNAYANKVIRKNAELHQGISHATILLITDDASVEEARSTMKGSVASTIAFAGTILAHEEVKLGPIKVDLSRYATHAMLAEARATTAENKRSCTISLYEPIHKIPEFKEDLLTDFRHDTTLRKHGESCLEAMENAAKAILAETNLLKATIEALLTKNKPHPYVTNFDDLVQSLSKAQKDIKKQATQIQENMGEQYRNDPKNIGVKLLESLNILDRAIENNINNLHAKQAVLEKTPHHAFFKNGEPLNLLTLSEENSATIIDAYKGSSPENSRARDALFTEIKFNLNALQRVMEKCDKVEKNRYIKNSVEAINELFCQMTLLEKMGDPTRCKAEKEQLETLAKKSLKHFEKRVIYLDEHINKDAKSIQEIYQELSSIRQSLSGLSTFHINTHALTKRINAMQDRMLPSIEASLHQHSFLQPQKTQWHDEIVLDGGQSLHTTPPIAEEDISRTKKTFVSPIRLNSGEKEITRNVDAKVIALWREEVTNLKIQTLKPIDEGIIAECEKMQSKFAKVAKGVRTEIEWVLAFQKKTYDKGIDIDNLPEVIDSYEKQLCALKHECDTTCFFTSPLASELKEAEKTLQALKKEALFNAPSNVSPR